MYLRFLSFPLVFTLFVSFVRVLFSAEHAKEPLADIKQKIADDEAVLIDVREIEEWEKGRLQSATLIPLSKLAGKEGEKLVEQLPQDKPIYCHCRAGGRALIAADILGELGYDCRALKQGYEELLKAGFEKQE